MSYLVGIPVGIAFVVTMLFAFAFAYGYLEERRGLSLFDLMDRCERAGARLARRRKATT